MKSDSIETDNVAPFKNAIKDLIQANDLLVVDLTEVEFMDSTGLGSLISLLRTLKSKGGTLAVASLQDDVRQLFEMVLMDRVFAIYPEASAAANAIENQP